MIRSDMQRLWGSHLKNPIAHKRFVTLACWRQSLGTIGYQRSYANPVGAYSRPLALTRTATKRGRRRSSPPLDGCDVQCSVPLSSPSWPHSPRHLGFSVDDRVGLAN